MPEAAAPPPLPLLAAASSPAAAALPRARRRQQQQRRGWRRPRRLLVWGALVAFFFIMNWWMFSRLQDPSARPHFRLRRHPPRAPATANSSLFTLEEVAGAAKGKRAHRVMLTRLLALAGHALAEAETRPEPKDLWEEPINATMWRPCSDQRDWKASEGTNGYIMISANGGINQQRVAICNAVTISRLLNATLVLPKFLYSNVWLDKSQFGDIYQEDYFIKYLKSDIQIVKDLPAELQSLDLEAIGSLVNDTDVMKEAKPSLYMKKVLPILLRNRVVHFIGFGNRLSFDPIPSDLQRLRCRCNFHALRFVHKIQETGAVLVERLHGHRASSSPLKDNLLGQFAIKSDPSANKSDASKYLAVHLRFEIDMVAYSLCYFGGGKDEEDELEAYRQIHFPVLSELRKTTKLPSAAFLRSEGKCPLAPEEAVLMLAAIGFKRSTNIYIAGAEIYGGKDRMAAISRLYPALVTKETLLSPSELEPFRNFSSQLAALDFIACAAADAFAMTDPGSQFSSLVQGYRMYYGGGDLPTVRPNKRRLASILVKNATIEWNEFESRKKDYTNEIAKADSGDRTEQQHSYCCYCYRASILLGLPFNKSCCQSSANRVLPSPLLLLCDGARWQLPNEQPNYLASTANERWRYRTPPPMDPEKLKAVIAGYSQSIFSCLKKLSSSVLEDLLFLFWIVTVGTAFIAATFLVFGGATAVMLYTADKLQLHSVDDVKTKGKDALQPRADMIKEQIAPLRSWAEEMSRKWHFEGDKEAKEKSVIIRELSRALGSRTTPS
ncbi:unnamed protein product [Miscanthus lutarioriparius]|uniref:O-fucosyltransferase family protein n=1 Tax=Miscanthus lutarioriparius TaxID=422564 RepID=A0A811S485_9POAL|nr:unnamed protein product [Miscanthus lutarioriparius]